MDEKHFYDSLMQYFVQNKLDAMVYYDTFTDESYGAFGKETIGIPRLFIDRDKSVGNIDIYGVEFYEPIESYIIKEFQVYIRHLNTFLKKYHKEKGNGYIVYRRNKSPGNHYLQGLGSDVFYNYFKKDHQEVFPENVVFKFLNKSYLFWCLYSNNLVEETFSKINKVLECMKKLNSDETFECGDVAFINSDLLTKGIHFRIYGEPYIIKFPEGEELIFELKMLKHLKSVPLIFYPDEKTTMKDKIEEIGIMNRLLLLFE